MCCGNWCKMTSMYPFCHCVFDYCLGNLATSESPVYKIVSLNSSIANSNVTTGEEKCLPDVSNTKIQKHIFHLSTGHTHLFIVLMHLCQKRGIIHFTGMVSRFVLSWMIWRTMTGFYSDPITCPEALHGSSKSRANLYLCEEHCSHSTFYLNNHLLEQLSLQSMSSIHIVTLMVSVCRLQDTASQYDFKCHVYKPGIVL